MSKIKKVLAMVLTLAMVMAMGMTSFAANEATITVDNAGASEFSYVQVIEPSRESVTGWAFTNETIAKAYKDAFGIADDSKSDIDEQKAIAMLILAKDSTATLPSSVKPVVAATADQINTALNTVRDTVEFTPMKNPQTVSEAGVYAIQAYEEGYTYNMMAAYVAFGPYDSETGAPTDLEDVVLNAKKQKNGIEKDAEDADKVVEIGRTEIFHVTGEVPYYPDNATNREYWIKDTLVGGEYVLDENQNVILTVQVGDMVYGDFRGVFDAATNSFKADLSSLITENNANANLPIDISYAVVVTDVTVGNDATMGDADTDGKFGTDSEKLYTGQITLTKYAEDGKTPLEGAGFEVRPIRAGLDTVEPLKFDKIEDGVYQYNPNGEITEVFTKADGTVVVRGLDIGGYQFTETTAPEGYSINEDGAIAVLEVEGDTATAIIEATTSLNDTKLAALPGTGGIGTTIFTVGGCLIMIVAAALFFASRKKSEN